MLKALLKKQLLEIRALFLRNKKTGKQISGKSSAAYTLLYIAVFICLGFMFYSASGSFAPLLDTNTPWMYFCFMGMIAILFGTFGSVFNTFSGLYRAKDNDLLLSMPIPPSYILLSRVSGVAAMGLLYEATVMIPAIILRCVYAPVSAVGVVLQILLIFVIDAFITVLSCALGWVVALIASRTKKNKSAITVIFSLVFFAAYYYFFSQAYKLIAQLLINSEAVGGVIRTWLYPFYLMGKAAEGDVVSMLLFALIVAVLLALVWFALSKTFVGITTKKQDGTRTVYREKTVRAAGMDAALLRKELKHFSGSATYMLNCALGTVFMVILAVLSVISGGSVREIAEVFGERAGMDAVLTAAVVAAAAAMNDLTAPSIPLEGKTLWVLQSLPVPTQKIFDAKQRLHWLLTMPPAVLLTACLAAVLKMDPVTALFIALFEVVFIMFDAAAGLAIGLRKPNLDWTSETVPVKQSLGVMIMLFGGLILAAAFCAGGCFALRAMDIQQYLLLGIAVFALMTRLINNWLRKKGTIIFEQL